MHETSGALLYWHQQLGSITSASICCLMPRGKQIPRFKDLAA
jgi:hypothetical protein